LVNILILRLCNYDKSPDHVESAGKFTLINEQFAFADPPDLPGYFLPEARFSLFSPAHYVQGFGVRFSVDASASVRVRVKPVLGTLQAYGRIGTGQTGLILPFVRAPTSILI
jgi:hypothetical protein